MAADEIDGDASGKQTQDHFASLVKDWSHFGPPLRPNPDDTAVVQRAIDGFGRAVDALVLGVTPETTGCRWPEGSTLTAIDHSVAMILALWDPRRMPPGSRAIQADWLAMPLPAGSIDLVAGDGAHNQLGGLEGWALAREVRRILRPAGRFVTRVFLRPEGQESVDEVSAAAQRGEIGSVHALKLRLFAALHGANGPGTRLDDVWRAWKAMPPPPQAARGERGWTADELAGIESYRGLETRYYLPTLGELRATFAPGLTELACDWGTHELGDRCPTLMLAAC